LRSRLSSLVWTRLASCASLTPNPLSLGRARGLLLFGSVELAAAVGPAPGVAPAVDVYGSNFWFWFAVFDGWESREGLGGEGLVPVGDGGQVQGEAVRVAVLDTGSEGLLEADGVFEVVAVHVGSAQPAETGRVV
jgi:hypothetical protein